MKSITKSVAAATALVAALGIAYAQSGTSGTTGTQGTTQGSSPPDAATTQSGTMNQSGSAGTMNQGGAAGTTNQGGTATQSGTVDAGTGATTGAAEGAAAQDPLGERAARADRN